MTDSRGPATAWGRVAAALAAAGGLTQHDLAMVLDCDRASVSRKLTGSRPWTERDQQRLARRFAAAAEQLQADLAMLRATHEYRTETPAGGVTTGHAA